MFNFTTQSVYNTITKATVDEVANGTVKNANVIVSSGNEKPYARIGNTRFDAVDVEEIQVKNPTVENLASVTFDMSKVLIPQDSADKERIARFVFYIGLSMNSQDSFYSNPFVYKGKPLFVEFAVKAGDTAAAVAKRAFANAKKYLLLSTGTEKILNVKLGSAPAEGSEDPDTSGQITFEGVNGYQQIKKAILQVWNPEGKTVDCCSNQGEFVDVVTGIPVIYTTDKTTGVVTTTSKVFDGITEGGRALALDGSEVAIAPGLEAFGDYNWIIHNLRLPTAANYYPWSPANRMGEMPVPGAQYVQVIIKICKKRDGIMGEIVGARGISVTTHVLYIEKNAYTNSQFGNIIDTLASVNNAKHTDADDKLKKPFEDR